MTYLFIGNYLSKRRGTKPVKETISQLLKDENGLDIRLVSRVMNRYLRLLDVISMACFAKYELAQIDVFSGKSFLMAEIAHKIVHWRKKKSILCLHGGMLPEYCKGKEARVKRFFHKAKVITSPSLYLGSYFEGLGIPVEYLPNPINLDKFPVKSYETLKASSLRLLWVRAFSEIYQPHLAVETLYLLKKHYPGSSLTMIGPDLGLLNQTKSHIERLGLGDSIDITGGVSNDELYKYFHNHDIYINTTRYESFGIAILEAAACGIPVISTNVGEIPLLWDNNKNILLTDSATPEAFVNEINKLIESSSLHFEIFKNARKKAEQFAWQAVKDKWLTLFDIDGKVH